MATAHIGDMVIAIAPTGDIADMVGMATAHTGDIIGMAGMVIAHIITGMARTVIAPTGDITTVSDPCPRPAA
jgi:hypothetical protein